MNLSKENQINDLINHKNVLKDQKNQKNQKKIGKNCDLYKKMCQTARVRHS